LGLPIVGLSNNRSSRSSDAPGRLVSDPPQDRRRPPDFGFLTGLIGYQLRRAQVAVFQHFADAFRELDITPGQLGTLVLVHANPGLSQSALGAALGIDRSTVVPLIDRLEARELVVRARSPTDRRSHALRLGPAGEQLLAEAERRVRAHEDAIAHRLSEAERRTLIELLAKIGPG
jgi:DNA-binding MarR family transcriptional regulator